MKISVLFLIVLIASLVSVVPTEISCNVSDPYNGKDELIGMFKVLCDAYPEYTSYESVGKTYEGRDIWMFKIGNPDGGRVLWDGQLHGNEGIGSEIIYLMIEWLLESGDPRAKRFLERNYVLFIPVINMDSYNRGNGNFENCRWGVDLNRNFKTGWRDIACDESQNYAGPYPASEPETQVLRNVFQTYRPQFYVNTHCGAGPFLSYYRQGDVTLALEVIDRINEVSSEMGITPYRVVGMGSTGFAIGDAASFGISSWLFEIVGSETCPHEDLVDIYYPKCLAVFVAMCEICEIKTTVKTVFEVPWNGETFQVVTESNSTVFDFYFSQPTKSIGFTVTGVSGTIGFCNVTIPEDLVWGDFSVYKNGSLLMKDIDYTQTYNASHYVFCITYTHTTHAIEIRSSHVIPEFFTWSSMLLIFTLLLVLTVFYKGRLLGSPDY
jgi:hypothetical protein